MKIVKIIFLSLLALILIIGTGIFIFLQTFDTDQYLPQINKKASLAIGRQVSIGHMGLGFSLRGITVDIGPLIVADDLDFSTQPFIKVDRIRTSLDLGSLIFHRRIHVTGILLQSPQIHFIRSQEGHINVRSIVEATRPVVYNTAVFVAPSSRIIMPPTGLKSSAGGVNAEELGLLKIQDASVSFIDQNQGFPLDIWLSNIDLNLSDLSLSKPFELSCDASLLSNAPNVHLRAQVFFDPLTRSFQINDLKLNTDLSQVDISRLKGISPQMRDGLIFSNIVGIVQLNIPHLEISSSGELKGNGDISITGGVIKGFNIIKTVLSHTLGVFGGIDGAIDDLFNGPLKDKLGAQDTTIEKAQAKFSLHDKTFFIDDSLVQTDIFELTARGLVDQGLNMDMQTVLHLNNDVSAALINELGGLKFLCDDSKRIAIGASLKGVLPHLKYKPNKDFRKKSKKFLMEDAGNILGALFTSSQGQGK